VVIPAQNARMSEAQILERDAPGAVQIDADTLPIDRTFRCAWRLSCGAVVEDRTTALALAHDCRRAKRDAEFAPLDREATIPAKARDAETARQVIRAKYATVQKDMDAAPDVDALRTIVKGL